MAPKPATRGFATTRAGPPIPPAVSAVRPAVAARPTICAGRSRRASEQHGLRWATTKLRCGASRHVSGLQSQIKSLQTQLDTARSQRDESKSKEKEASKLHGDAVLAWHAEDWLWRKRYRTLQKKHSRWVADLKEKDKAVESDGALLELLAEAAAWDREATIAEDADRRAATEAAKALLEAGKKQAAADVAMLAAKSLCEDADAKASAAKEMLEEALLKEAAADQALAAAAATEAATATAAAAAEEAVAAAAHAAASGPSQSTQRAAPKKPVLRFTDAEPGTKSHTSWRTRQRNSIVQFMISLFGVGWHREFVGDSARNEVVFVDPHKGRSTKPSDVVEILDSFFKMYQDLFDKVGEPTRRRGRNIAVAAEAAVADAIQEHIDKVVIAVHTECALTDHGYQSLINYTSNIWVDNQMIRLELPFGTSMPKWMSKNKLKEQLSEATAKLGIEIKPGSAWLDPKAVVIQRLMELIARGLVKLEPGMTIKVQLLGDATTVWKSMKVNGTTLVLKVIYNDKDQNGVKLEKDGVNTVENQKAIGFYLGDDTQAQIKLHAPDLPDKLAELCNNGVVIDGIPIKIRLLLGGDLKFINSMLGLKNNASLYPCPFCITHHKLLGLCMTMLLKHKATYNAELAKRKEEALPGLAGSGRGRGRGRAARGRGGAQGRGGLSTAAKKSAAKKPTPPITYLGPRTNQMQLQLAHVEGSECCPGDKCWKKIIPENEPEELSTEAAKNHHQWHFSTAHMVGILFWCIQLEDVIIDALHVVLRVVPAIYRATVSAHVDSAECESISQWIFDVHRIIVSSKTAVQSATGKEATVGTECWHGAVCEKMLQIYPDVLDQVHSQNAENKKHMVAAWDAFLEWLDELHKGCDDDDKDDVERHAVKLKDLAEIFVNRFKKVASEEQVTPYMHCMMIDIPDQVRRHGGLLKYSAQGVERLHQWVKFIVMYRSNKHHDTIGKQVMQGLTVKGADKEMPARRQGQKRKEAQHGGHMSKKARQEMDHTKEGLQRAIALRKQEEQQQAVATAVEQRAAAAFATFGEQMH